MQMAVMANGLITLVYIGERPKMILKFYKLAEKQQNARFERWGINQKHRVQKSVILKKIKLAIWYNDNFREIQPLIGSTRDVNEQTDKNLRTHLNYEKSVKKWRLNNRKRLFHG